MNKRKIYKHRKPKYKEKEITQYGKTIVVNYYEPHYNLEKEYDEKQEFLLSIKYEK